VVKMVDLKYVIAPIIFTNAIMFLLALGGYITFVNIPFLNLSSQIVVIIVQTLPLIATIFASNTPIVKGATLGIYCVALFGIFALIQLPEVIPLEISTVIYSLVFIPSFLGVAYTF